MPGRVEGKVAFITGAARGQGRSHAMRLAAGGRRHHRRRHLCDRSTSVTRYPLAHRGRPRRDGRGRSRRSTGGSSPTKADVRDYAALKAALDDGVAQLGRARHRRRQRRASSSFGARRTRSPSEQWHDMIDVNLTGVWHTAKAVDPAPDRAAARGGSIIITSSTAGIKGYAEPRRTTPPAKHGVVGLMRTLALELAPHRIRVNTVHPTSVDTDMIMNDATCAAVPARTSSTPTRAGARRRSPPTNALPVPWVRDRSTSATPCCSWPPTRRATSPASS